MAKLIFEIRSNSSRCSRICAFQMKPFEMVSWSPRVPLKGPEVQPPFWRCSVFFSPAPLPPILEQVCYSKIDGEVRHLIGLRDFTDQLSLAGLCDCQQAHSKKLPRILNPVFPTECVFLIHCFSSHGKCPSFRPPDRPTICRTQRHGSNPRASSGTCRRSESCRIESSK